MRSCLAWTDYPEEGVESGRCRPMRRITVVGYDHDKYVEILEYPFQIKRGYVYRTRRRRPILSKTLKRKYKEPT